jgi:hypothetical protein
MQHKPGHALAPTHIPSTFFLITLFAEAAIIICILV